MHSILETFDEWHISKLQLTNSPDQERKALPGQRQPELRLDGL